MNGLPIVTGLVGAAMGAGFMYNNFLPIFSDASESTQKKILFAGTLATGLLFGSVSMIDGQFTRAAAAETDKALTLMDCARKVPANAVGMSIINGSGGTQKCEYIVR